MIQVAKKAFFNFLRRGSILDYLDTPTGQVCSGMVYAIEVSTLLTYPCVGSPSLDMAEKGLLA